MQIKEQKPLFSTNAEVAQHLHILEDMLCAVRKLFIDGPAPQPLDGALRRGAAGAQASPARVRHAVERREGELKSRSFLSRLFRYAVERRLWLHEGWVGTQGCHVGF